MFSWIKAHLLFPWRAVWRPRRRAFMLLWVALSTWDLLVAQFLPPEWANKSPRVYDALVAMSGWLPWRTWALIGLGILLALSIEYGVRQKHKAKPEGAADTTNKRQMVPLLDALRWIIDNSGWEPGHGPDPHLGLAAIEVRQAARDSEVTIRGRREIERHMPGEAFDQTWENIEHSYWDTHEIDVGGIMTGGCAHQETQVIYQSLGDIVSESMPHYAMLRIYKHEMEARWHVGNTSALKKLAK